MDCNHQYFILTFFGNFYKGLFQAGKKFVWGGEFQVGNPGKASLLEKGFRVPLDERGKIHHNSHNIQRIQGKG